MATMVGCDACSIFDANVESHVDAPVTLSELEDWATERGLSAEVGMLERGQTGNIACGHSAACLILVPLVVADALLPSTLKRGSVTDDDGLVLYTGVFDLRGRLLRARVRIDDTEAGGNVYREIARLDLPELGEHPIVELARVRVGAEGDELERTETPLLGQVDLVAMYAESLAGEGDGDGRADLVVEQLQKLGAPGLAAVEARYAGLSAIDDEELVQVLHEVCHGHAPGAELIVRVVGEKGGLGPAIKAVLCLEQDRLEPTHFSSVVERIVDAACEGDEVGTALPAVVTLGRQLPEAVAERAGECADEVRRLHLLFHAGQRPSDDELGRILREDDQAILLVRAMPPRDEANRQVLVAALDAPPVRLAIARALKTGTTGSPSADELRKGTAVYAAELGGSDVPDLRHFLLGWMGRADADVRAVALGPLRARADEPHNAAALVYLGSDHGRLGAALRGFDPDRVYWSRGGSHVEGTFTEHAVVAYALTEAGCTRDEIQTAARAVRGGSAPAPCAAW
ncbi:MAG: hypothetical protein DRJ42_19710 [Deltaproteobacteria bacterium]|nr:MAG: hypothetical protein DRJ42_19710 [Deltaproteobacteria bacterium]